MSTLIFLATLICGVLTLAFVVNGVVRQARGKEVGGIRGFLAVSFLSLLTTGFTVWQLLLAVGSVHW